MGWVGIYMFTSSEHIILMNLYTLLMIYNAILSKLNTSVSHSFCNVNDYTMFTVEF